VKDAVRSVWALSSLRLGGAGFACATNRRLGFNAWGRKIGRRVCSYWIVRGGNSSLPRTAGLIGGNVVCISFPGKMESDGGWDAAKSFRLRRCGAN